MDPRERTIEWLRRRASYSCTLSAVPSLVYSFYVDHIFDCEATARLALSADQLSGLRFRDLTDPRVNTATIVGYAGELLRAVFFHILREERVDLGIDFGLCLYGYVVPKPLPITGRIQSVFRVNGEVRGVAAIGNAPLDALTARCLIGMEFLAEKLHFVGPVFGVALTRMEWSIVEMPVHYAHDEIPRDHRIHRFHGSHDSNQSTDTELFLGTLRAVVMRTASFSQ